MKKITGILFVIIITLLLALGISAEEGIISDEGRLPFEDVKENHWFTPYIKFCYANGIINGMNEYTVVPNGTLTRAQFVTMLCNLEGVDTSSYTVDKFTDVKASHWYYGAIAWAYNEGIVSGINETTFAPSKTLTRAELATVMYNYMKDQYELEASPDVLDKFPDKPKAEYWYYDSICYAVSARLISGMANGTLAATGTVTRAQAAVIFEAFMRNYFYASCEHSFSEASCTEASVCSECGLVDKIPAGHRLTVYDCGNGGTCLTCGEEVAPSDILHNFVAANCVSPRRCSNCGKTRGTPNEDHRFQEADCVNPKFCVVCTKQFGSPLGHTTDRGYCGRCGFINIGSGYDCIAFGLMQKGGYDSEIKAHTTYKETATDITALVYYPAEDVITLENITAVSDTVVDALELRFKENSSVCTFTYVRAKADGSAFVATGSFNVETYTTSSNIVFTTAQGGNGSQYQAAFNTLLRRTLAVGNDNARTICWCSDGGLNHLGFKAY